MSAIVHSSEVLPETTGGNNSEMDASKLAGNILEQLAIEVQPGTIDERLVSVLQDTKHFWEQYAIKELCGPSSWRILKKADNGDYAEEAVFTIHGIIHSKDLPPVTEKVRMQAYRYRYLKQCVTLTGRRTPTFSNVLAAAKNIHRHFDRQFVEGLLEAWSLEKDYIHLSNRYLTPQNEGGGLEAVNFLPGVDPKGILRGMAKGDGTMSYIHTDENRVKYYNVRGVAHGVKRYEPCEPQTFRIGDIVQAQVSFVVIPIRGGRRKMLAVLRSLALLDGQFGQGEIGSPKLHNEHIPKTRLAAVKRRIGYDDNMEGTQDDDRRRNIMHIDDSEEV